MKAPKNLISYISNTTSLCLFFLFLSLSQNSISQQLAFPSAYGAGAYTVGGRYGTVSHVTTLADSGPGSLRSFANISNTTIVFDVSGVIKLRDQLYFTGNNVTIAGQTAPKGGITIDGHRVVFLKNSQFICRYIRFRGGYYAPRDNDTVSGYSLNDVVFDHCSFSFALDEALSIVVDRSGEFAGNVTVQNCLLAESKKGSIMGSMGSWQNSSGSDHFRSLTMVYNVYYNITHRHPNLVGSGRSDIINNYIHNAKYRLINARNGSKLNQLNNIYDFGTAASSATIYDKTLNLFTCIPDESISKIYTSGNEIKGLVSKSSTNLNSNSLAAMKINNKLMWKYFYDNDSSCGYGMKMRGDQLESDFFVSNEYPLLGLAPEIHSVDNLKNKIVMNSGASSRLNADGSISNNDDDFDSNWKNNIMSNKYINRIPESEYTKLNIKISSQSRPSGFYKTNPHIPEEFFKAHVPEGQDHNDLAPSGYTWLEEYLNGVDRSTDAIAAKSVEVTPKKSEIQVSKTFKLSKTFTPTNTTNQNGTWASSDEAIAKVDNNGLVTAISVGVVTISFTATDGGYKDKSEITVFQEALQVSAGIDQQICKGSSATLTATGGATYLWSTGETTNSIKVTPEATTTYTLTAYDDTGKNSDSDDVKVTVNPMPTVDAGNNITINSGESTTLTATGAVTYEWNTGATGASITVSPTATKTYKVTGIKNGCEAIDTVKVTVHNSVEVIADAGVDQKICKGSSTTLTATGGATYLWSTGEKTASISVSPSSTTTYTVTAYDGAGKNSDTDDVKVTVNPMPTVDAGNNVTINAGESTTLTATGASNYNWNTGANSSSITVSPTATKTYTVTGTKNGCEATDKVTVTVKNAAKVVANAGSDQNICSGSSTTLTATGGDTYLWSTGAKTESITVNPSSKTTYSVTAFMNDASGTDEVVVYVDAQPNVRIINGSDATILEGEFITLSASGANTYKWSNGATQPNIAVSPRVTKSYEVTGFVNNCAAQKSITVNVFEKVVADAGNDVTICHNDNTILTASGPDNTEYLWSTGETTKSITVDPKEDTEYSVMVYHALDSDTDNVMVKVENCKTPEQITEESTELTDDSTKLELLIHPNPTYGEVNIKVSGLTNLSSIHLYDLSGKSLYTETINEGDQQRYEKSLDLSDYASGIYLLQLVDNYRVITKKIVLR